MPRKIYQGSTKTLYESENENFLIMTFEDWIHTGGKKTSISGKGSIINMISSYLMQKLSLIGVEHHLVRKINMNQQLIHRAESYPIQIYISNVACGRYVTDFNMEEGTVLHVPFIDYRVKNRNLNYPAVNEQQIMDFGWMSKYELKEIRKLAGSINDFLVGLFAGINIRMVDICLEFGRVLGDDEIVITLIDEISPNNCRLWDMDSNQRLCYDLLEKEGPDGMILAYQQVLSRLKINGK